MARRGVRQKRDRSRRSGHKQALNTQDYDHGSQHLTPDERIRYVAYIAARVFLAGHGEKWAAEYERVSGSSTARSVVAYTQALYDELDDDFGALYSSRGTVKPAFAP